MNGSPDKKFIVYILDDHKLFGSTLSNFLMEYPDILLSKSFTQSENLLKSIDSKTPQVVILDYEMPGLNGLDVAEKIIQKHLDIKLIMLTMHDQYRIIYQAIEEGIHAFLLKNTDPDELYKAIKSVLKNDFYSNDITARALTKGVRTDTKRIEKEILTITSREKEVLINICNELTMREISEKLNISENTVKNHRQSLMKKLGAGNSVGLVKKAVQYGLYSL